MLLEGVIYTCSTKSAENISMYLFPFFEFQYHDKNAIIYNKNPQSK